MGRCRRQLEIPESTEKLLILSDIHAFFGPLREIEKLKAHELEETQVLFTGDLFGVGADPLESIQWLMSHAGPFTAAGNHDDDVAFMEPPRGSHRKNTFEGIRQMLSNEQAAFMQDMPYLLNVKWRGHDIQLFHSHRLVSGETHGEDIIRWTPQDYVERFANPSVSLVVAGHTHFPFVRPVGNSLIANCGSTSIPIIGNIGDDGRLFHRTDNHNTPWDHRPSFLEVAENGGNIDVKIIHFQHNRDDALRRLKDIGEPDYERWRVLMMEGVYMTAPVFEQVAGSSKTDIMEHVRHLKTEMGFPLG